MIMVQPVTLAVSLALSGGLLLVIVFALWWMDRFDREPVSMVVAAFFWGAVFAPLMVEGVESLLYSAASFDSSLIDWRLLVFGIGPITTEIPKAVGLFLVLSLTRTFDSPSDGFVYGAAVGAGFAVTGPLVSDLTAGIGTGVSAVDAGRIGVVFWSTGIHVLASAALGACVGAGRLASSTGRRLACAVAGLVGAVLLNGVSSWIGISIGTRLVAGQLWASIVPVYALLVMVGVLMLFAESRILKRQLADEVRLGVIPAWAEQVIPSYWRRLRSDWWPLRRERTVISRLLTRLAFRKEALKNSKFDSANLDRLEILRLRERVQKIICPPRSPVSPLTEDMW